MVAVGAVFYILPTNVAGDTYVDKGISILIISIIIGALNLTVKPILNVISFPINVVTLGLFSIVINAAIIKIADIISESFAISGFWNYVIFGLLLSVVHVGLSVFEDKD